MYITAIHQITDPEEVLADRARAHPSSGRVPRRHRHAQHVREWERHQGRLPLAGGDRGLSAGSRGLGPQPVQPERVLRGEQGDRNRTAGLIARRTPAPHRHQI